MKLIEAVKRANQKSKERSEIYFVCYDDDYDTFRVVSESWYYGTNNFCDADCRYSTVDGYFREKAWT